MELAMHANPIAQLTIIMRFEYRRDRHNAKSRMKIRANSRKKLRIIVKYCFVNVILFQR